MLFTAAFGMTAYADKAIKTVGIKVTGTVNAGSPIGDEKLEIKPLGSRYTVRARAGRRRMSRTSRFTCRRRTATTSGSMQRARFTLTARSM